MDSVVILSEYIYRCYSIVHAVYTSILFEKIAFDDLDSLIYEATENMAKAYPIRQIQLEMDYYSEHDGDAERSLAMNFLEDEGPTEVKAFISKNIGAELENTCDLEIVEIELTFY